MGRVAFLALTAVFTTLAAFLGIAQLVDAGEPVHWGTFTEERCEEGGRFGCQSIGTWVSEDGRLRLEDVYLDGRPSSDGTVAASYQPTGILNDASRNIVHAPVGAALEPLVPWMMVAFGVGVFVSWTLWRRESQ